MLRKVAGCHPGNIVSLFGNDKNVKSLKYGIFLCLWQNSDSIGVNCIDKKPALIHN